MCVAITTTYPSPGRSEAGLSAGSMPMTGMCSSCRSGPAAALVAVLQAITTALQSMAISLSTAKCVSRSTSSGRLSP